MPTIQNFIIAAPPQGIGFPLPALADLIEFWSDEQAFLDFIHSQAFEGVTTWGKEQILSARPQHKAYMH